MGVWHEFCVVCGGPPYGPTIRNLVSLMGKAYVEDNHDAMLKFAKETRWAKRWIGVSSTEETVLLGWYTEYGAFHALDGKGDFNLQTNFLHDNVPEGERYGIGAHRACATLLKQELGYSLRFADIFHLAEGIPYGPIEKYHAQYFEYVDMWEDGLAWMLRDPLEGFRNRRRILSIWQPFVRNIRAQEAKKKGKRPPRAKGAVGLTVKARRPGNKGKAR